MAKLAVWFCQANRRTAWRSIFALRFMLESRRRVDSVALADVRSVLTQILESRSVIMIIAEVVSRFKQPNAGARLADHWNQPDASSSNSPVLLVLDC